jgi:hypothetical protein
MSTFWTVHGVVGWSEKMVIHVSSVQNRCWLMISSIKSQIGKSEIFKNWRWTPAFSIWAGFSIRRKGLVNQPLK